MPDEICKLLIDLAIRNRRREHKADRCAVIDAQFRQRAVLGRKGDGSDIAAGHRSAPNRRRIDVEGTRNRFEHEPLAQSDAQVARDDLHDIGCDERLLAGAQDSLEHRLASPTGALSRRLRDLAE